MPEFSTLEMSYFLGGGHLVEGLHNNDKAESEKLTPIELHMIDSF